MLSQSWAYDKVICIAFCKLPNGKEKLTIQIFCFLQALPAENGNICEFGTVYLQPEDDLKFCWKDGQETINMMVDKLCSFLARMHASFLSFECFHTDVKLLKLPNPHEILHSLKSLREGPGNKAMIWSRAKTRNVQIS